MPTPSPDVFIHSGLASNPKNWSQDALPGPNSVPPNTGIFNQGTMAMAGAPEKLNLEVFGTPTLIMNGHGQIAKVSIVNGGLNVVSTGNNSLSINEGGVPGPYSHNDISFSGTLHLS